VAPATLYQTGNHTAEIHLDAPQYGIAPGQAAVCYHADKSMARVLGGGWIIHADNSEISLAA